ncbi:MAG: cysteine peptidase family C39 domain-containing protein [Gemmatimonadaceae bacterium]
MITPILQERRNDCGIACAVMLLGHAGCSVLLRDVQEQLPLTERGVSAHDLIRVLGRYGLDVAGVDIGGRHPAALPTPCIIYWRRSHFVILERASDESVTVVDPRVGRVVLSVAAFDSANAGVAIILRSSRNGAEKIIDRPS